MRPQEAAFDTAQPRLAASDQLHPASLGAPMLAGASRSWPVARESPPRNLPARRPFRLSWDLNRLGCIAFRGHDPQERLCPSPACHACSVRPALLPSLLRYVKNAVVERGFNRSNPPTRASSCDW